MAGWHHRLNGYEFEQTLGNSEGQEKWKDRSWSLLFQYFWLEWQEEWWSLLDESLNFLLYTLPGREKPSSVNIPSSAPHLTHSSPKRTSWLWQVWIHFSELDKVTLLKDLSLWSLDSFISFWDPGKSFSSICVSVQTQIFPLSSAGNFKIWIWLCGRVSGRERWQVHLVIC